MQYTLNPLYSCGLDIEMTSHYFLHCPLLHAEQSTPLNNINEIDSTILNKSESVVTRILLYGDESFKDEVNFLIFNATIDFFFFLSRNRFFMKHVIFSEFTGAFSFYSWLYGNNFILSKILIFTLSYYFFLHPWHPIVMLPGDCCFYVYCLNVHFHKKKK